MQACVGSTMNNKHERADDAHRRHRLPKYSYQCSSFVANDYRTDLVNGCGNAMRRTRTRRVTSAWDAESATSEAKESSTPIATMPTTSASETTAM
jgi:hypothetical protein